MKYESLSCKIIGCAYRVYNNLGFGFLESVYEKCLLIELEKANLETKAQHPIAVYYDNMVELGTSNVPGSLATAPLPGTCQVPGKLLFCQISA